MGQPTCPSVSARCGEAGFTLLEALVALVLSGIIVAMLAVVAGQWMPNWRRSFAAVQSTDGLNLGLERVVADIAAAKFIPARGASRDVLFEGTPTSLIFVRTSVGTPYPAPAGQRADCDTRRPVAPNTDERGHVSRLHTPKAGFWIRFWVCLVYPIAGAVFRLKWRNLERIPAPEDGAVIIAVNHTSQIDTLLMARLVWQAGRIPRFMIKAGVFGWPLFGPAMTGAGQIPVARGTMDAAQSLQDAVAALKRGEAVVIYPEGTTTKDPDNWPMQGKTGIGRLVLLSPDTPVVPIGQWGAQKMGGPSLRRLGRRRVSLACVGEPMDFSRFHGVVAGQRVQREITDEIMRAIRAEVAELRGETPPEKFFVPKRRYVDKR